MKLLLTIIVVGTIVALLTSCQSLDQRAHEYPVRHPCGNVWNYCYGDNYWMDKVWNILNGVN